MIEINTAIEPASLSQGIRRLWEISGPKVKRLCLESSPDLATPVYTVNGRYTARGWTEWTQGFLYGEAILQFDATGDDEALEQAASPLALPEPGSKGNHIGPGQ